MTFRSLLLLIASILAVGCNDDDGTFQPLDRNEPDDVVGLSYVQAPEDRGLATIYSALTSALRANANISIVAEIDHQANAQAINEQLDSTRVVLFGNPRLGTPLMQINPQAGLDLPQKMLVYRPGDDEVIVAYNTPTYLANRHGVGSAATLQTIEDALRNLAGTTGMGDVEDAEDNDVALNEGVIGQTDKGTVDSVYMRLRAALFNNPDITIVAELDHQANAASVGLDLPPIRLIVFGNPALGTPLLQDEQIIGIDLPQKMLVYASGDRDVTVAYNDPFYLAERHGVDRDIPESATIRDALAQLTEIALGR
ncbi:DUF302 domain-containing protein [Neolewinella maritima]|nr:DUF302 domain-containing protein [Neolewinella maritima]